MTQYTKLLNAIREAVSDLDPASETEREKVYSGRGAPASYSLHTILDGREYLVLVVPTAQSFDLTGKGPSLEPVQF